MNLIWEGKHFGALSAAELHAILALRQAVFVVAQHCAYQDADRLDPVAWHLAARLPDGTLTAYARVLPPALSHPGPAIGRLLTAPQVRRQGLGAETLRRAITYCERAFPRQTIHVAAQTYLQTFYEKFGFVACGIPYDEDGIAHIHMVRHAPMR
jgi:ElaA protein